MTHGPLQVDKAHPQHFIYGDGARCFLMGYEADWLMQIDQTPSDLARIKALLDKIGGLGFNMVVVSSYSYAHLGRWGREEHEHDPKFVTPKIPPWVGGNATPDYGRLDNEFFYHFDRIMVELLKRGILAHIMIHVYNKEVCWPELGTADDDRYWRYLVARYQAFPNVIWDPAKEAYYQTPEYVWGRLGTIRSLDGYRRLLTVHDPNRGAPRNQWAMSRRTYYDPRKDLSDALVDFKSDQIHLDWYADAVRNYLAAQRPYVNVECGYERGVEEVPTLNPLRMQRWREVLRRTWLVTMGGAYINYHYCNTAWSLFIPEPDPPGYSAHQLYRDFWSGTRYWLLCPDNTPLGEDTREGRYCRSNLGQEYVVFDETGQGFDLTITDATAPLHATWFNPVGGETVDAGILNNGKHSVVPPWGRGNWAVLHVRA